MYLSTAGLQIIGAILSFAHNSLIGVLNVIAAACSVAMWVLAKRSEDKSLKTPSSR
ncbi:hypothetical protein [Paenarthrobacter sp. NPDC090522]|uniref:hypothetical protein n=1 Tax=Paenarthrobacter sp. NPDC090522 TaxID=3364383 RepID=UPI0037FB3763